MPDRPSPKDLEGDPGSGDPTIGRGTTGAGLRPSRAAVGLFLAVTPLLILAALLMVPLLTATGLLDYRAAADRIQIATARQALAKEFVKRVLVTRSGVAIDHEEPAREYLRLGHVLTGRVAARADELDDDADAVLPLDDTGAIRSDAARAALRASQSAMRDLMVQGLELHDLPDGDPSTSASIVETLRLEDEVLATSRDLIQALRRDAASRLSRVLVGNGIVLGAIVLLGLLQATLLVRLRRLNEGLRREVARRIDSEARAVASEQTQRRTAADLRVARDAAESANRAKSQFIASMSHELRTPLNAIMGSVFLLEQTAQRDGFADMLEDIERIRGAGAQQLAMVDDLLDMAKIEAGMMKVHPEAFDPAALCREVVETIRPLAEARRTTITFEAGPLGHAHTDAMRVRQILQNLLSNAAKFTEDGTIRLEAHRVPAGTNGAASETARESAPEPATDPTPAAEAATEPASEPPTDPTPAPASELAPTPAPDGAPDDPADPHDPHAPEPSGDRLRFVVRDTGIGMDPADAERVFQEFVQADASITRRYGGTGLGLALTRRFCALLGGDVSVESAPGVGSTFTVELPAHRSPSPSESLPRG